MQILVNVPDDYYEILNNIPAEQLQADALVIRFGTPIPKKHGRLIDADAILKFYKGFCNINCDRTKQEREIMCRSCEIDDAIGTIENAPTIIESTEKKGEQLCRQKR